MLCAQVNVYPNATEDEGQNDLSKVDVLLSAEIQRLEAVLDAVFLSNIAVIITVDACTHTHCICTYALYTVGSGSCARKCFAFALPHFNRDLLRDLGWTRKQSWQPIQPLVGLRQPR